jgi:hypothetical protein
MGAALNNGRGCKARLYFTLAELGAFLVLSHTPWNRRPRLVYRFRNVLTEILTCYGAQFP